MRTAAETQVLDCLSPHLRALKDAERLAALEGIVGRVQQPHLITCPHCLVGGAVVTVKYRSDGSLQLPLKDPVRCLSCDRWFAIRCQLKMNGAPLNAEVAIAGSRT